MKRKIIIALFLLASIALSLLFGRSVFHYLTYNAPVKANILVVEGWIPDYGLQKAYDEFKNGGYDYLITTGSMLPNHITLSINSYLIFYPHQSVLKDEAKELHLFEMEIVSTLGKKDSAHFVFWVNDQRITEHYTTENKGFFQVLWKGRLSDIDSVMVQFTNDKVSKKGDRNLSIKKLNLNAHNLIVENADLFFDRGRPFGRNRWNFTAVSHAERAANYFNDRGLSSNKVIPVSNHYKNRRRTYGNALSLKHWLEANPMEIKGFNVVSMDYHSRRTWLTYNKLLDDFGRVGIISAENPEFEIFKRKRQKKATLELIALVYYYLFILPWI